MARMNPEVAAPFLVDWSEISGRDRIDLWERLGGFVEFLVGRYGLAFEIRPCWWRHGEVVEELTALWLARQHLYSDRSVLTAAMSWQDTFHKSRSRLRDMFGSCRDFHVEPIGNDWMTDDNRRDFLVAVRAEVEEDSKSLS
ncbi:DUF4913 domain-containing protein [Frankia sp. B2]|uniref:DUF4913 domain-containing protein n=1 Tax=Frankia sp. B2 TaxID=2541730 RepID=UPI00197A9266|nr:DUF4913 domain-containing protein [Frankia sp. B2]